MTDGPVEILLVEDSEDDVEFFVRSFKKVNPVVRLRVVGDGEEALDYIYGSGCFSGRNAANRPKVVFLDLKLPKVSGLEVLRRLKSHADTRIIPIVALTSSQEERDLMESYKLGVNSYIVKPMDFSEFSESVFMICQYWLQINKTP